MHYSSETPELRAGSIRDGSISKRDAANTTGSRINLQEVNTAALKRPPELLQRWLPNGQLRGNEWVALNPRRDDKHLGSFCINVKTGRWGDFAWEAAREVSVSLATFLGAVFQGEAARNLANMMGVRHG